MSFESVFDTPYVLRLWAFIFVCVYTQLLIARHSKKNCPTNPHTHIEQSTRPTKSHILYSQVCCILLLKMIVIDKRWLSIVTVFSHSSSSFIIRSKLFYSFVLDTALDLLRIMIVQFKYLNALYWYQVWNSLFFLLLLSYNNNRVLHRT